MNKSETKKKRVTLKWQGTCNNQKPKNKVEDVEVKVEEEGEEEDISNDYKIRTRRNKRRRRK